MAGEFTKCLYVDPNTTIECDTWYPYEDGQKFCLEHRHLAKVGFDSQGGHLAGYQIDDKSKEVNHIPRTVTVISSSNIQRLNDKIAVCLKMSIPEIVAHIQSIEEKIKELEHDRRAANIAKRNLEDHLSEEERSALRETSRGYKVSPDETEKQPKVKKSPEEKAKTRKEGFSAWAARLGVKVDELMVMDDDEMADRIAKYKASRG